MPNRSKQKGDRSERMIVELFRAAGVNAYRVPLSGAATGFKSDVEVRLPGTTLRLESKVRDKGFSRIYQWITGHDGLVIRADHKEALLVIPLDRFVSLLGGQGIAGRPEPSPNTAQEIQQQTASLELPKGQTVYLNAGKPTIRV